VKGCKVFLGGARRDWVGGARRDWVGGARRDLTTPAGRPSCVQNTMCFIEPVRVLTLFEPQIKKPPKKGAF